MSSKLKRLVTKYSFNRGRKIVRRARNGKDTSKTALKHKRKRIRRKYKPRFH